MYKNSYPLGQRGSVGRRRGERIKEKGPAKRHREEIREGGRRKSKLSREGLTGLPGGMVMTSVIQWLGAKNIGIEVSYKFIVPLAIFYKKSK